MKRIMLMSIVPIIAAMLYVVPSTSQAASTVVCTAVQRGNPVAATGHYVLSPTMTFNCETVGIKTIGQLGALGWKIAHVELVLLHGNTQVAYQLVIEHV